MFTFLVKAPPTPQKTTCEYKHISLGTRVHFSVQFNHISLGTRVHLSVQFNHISLDTRVHLSVQFPTIVGTMCTYLCGGNLVTEKVRVIVKCGKVFLCSSKVLLQESLCIWSVILQHDVCAQPQRHLDPTTIHGMACEVTN